MVCDRVRRLIIRDYGNPSWETGAPGCLVRRPDEALHSSSSHMLLPVCRCMAVSCPAISCLSVCPVSLWIGRAQFWLPIARVVRLLSLESRSTPSRVDNLNLPSFLAGGKHCNARFNACKPPHETFARLKRIPRLPFTPGRLLGLSSLHSWPVRRLLFHEAQRSFSAPLPACAYSPYHSFLLSFV